MLSIPLHMPTPDVARKGRSMARPKRPPHPMLRVAREHVRRLNMGLDEEPIHLRMLDGPPGAPRYAVYVGACMSEGGCPHGISDRTTCPVLECKLRHSLRMLLDRDGNLVELLRGGVRWTS
jgi:hypothetical protein